MSIRSFGYVTVGTPGTPVRATVHQTDPTARVGAQALLFQALHGNTGRVYIGLSGMDKTAGTGVLAVLPAPSDPTSGPFASFSPSQPLQFAGLNVADFYIDADVGTNGVVVAATEG